MKSIFIFLLSIISFEMDAQFELLRDIASGASSGLNFSFRGEINENGKLYFSGSTNQFNYTLWETDGTIGGTKNTIGTSEIKSSDEMVFGEERVFIKDFDGGVQLKVYDPTVGLSTVSFFENKNFSDIHFMGDRAILSGSTIKIFTTDGTNAGSYELDNLSGNSFNTVVTTNDSVGVIIDDGFSPSFEPTIIYNNGQSSAELVDYLAPVMSLERVRNAAVIEELILIQDVQGGFVENSIYNLNTKQFASFEFFGSYIDGFRLGDKVIAISQNSVFAINPDDFSFESLINEEVFAFTSVSKTDDKFYFIAKDFGSPFQYYESDGTAEGTRALTGTDIPTNSFNPVQAVFDGKLFYIDDNGTSQDKMLKSYDLSTDEIKEVGVASESTGGVIVKNTLKVVNDKLVISRYTSDNGHEMYIFDSANDIDDFEFNDLISMQTNLVNDVMNITSLLEIERVSITDMTGQTYSVSSIHKGENIIDISNLPSGNHFITVFYPNGLKSYPFIKI